MTIEEAAIKAIEGGWSKSTKQELDEVVDGKSYRQVVIDNSVFDFHFLLLDPLFWQSLGKSLGWGKQFKGKSFLNPKPLIGLDGLEYSAEKEWLYHWHRFIDFLAGGKSAEEFFETLK